MPFADPRSLKDVGLRPEGTGPSPMETIIGGAGKFVDSYFEEQEKQNKKAKDNLDMYVTLRKAGYTSDQAADAVRKKSIVGGPKYDVLGAEAETAAMKPEKERAELEKTRAETKKAEAYAKYYEEGGAKTGKPQDKLRQEIIDSLNSGDRTIEDLTPEEKKLLYGYTEKDGGESLSDKILKAGIGDENKKSWTPPNWLSNIIGKFESPDQKKQSVSKKELMPETSSEEKVKVTNPQGKDVMIKASQLKAALNKGYKVK